MFYKGKKKKKVSSFQSRIEYKNQLDKICYTGCDYKFEFDNCSFLLLCICLI